MWVKNDTCLEPSDDHGKCMRGWKNYWGRSWFYLSWFHELELLKEVVGTCGHCRRKYQKLSDIGLKYNSAHSWYHLSLW